MIMRKFHDRDTSILSVRVRRVEKALRCMLLTLLCYFSAAINIEAITFFNVTSGFHAPASVKSVFFLDYTNVQYPEKLKTGSSYKHTVT